LKVRTKLGLLLFVVVATFIAGLIGISAYDHYKFHEIAVAREEERRGSFDDVIRYWREPLEIFVQYYSVWDDMVAAIQKPTPGWSDGNLSDTVLTSYRAHAVWAYHPDATIAFTRNLLYSDKLSEVPLPPGAMRQLLDQAHRIHFFAETPVGLMEIEGATVHGSRDSARAEPPSGYLFVGRLWSNAEIGDIALFTGNKIQLVPPDSAAPAPRLPARNSVVSFRYNLPGWDGRPLAVLDVRNESPVVEQLMRSSNRLLFGLVCFAVVLFLTLLWALTGWVTLPLKALSVGLKSQGAGGLPRLQPKSDEFGELARMMGSFFEQRQSLLREMNDRRLAEEALHESEERLRQSQKMEAVGRLAGGIAHDFNNLLTAIIGYAELIARRTSESFTREEAGLIRKAGEQAADLTKQLLAFSRKQILQPRVLDLNVLVEDMQKLLRRVIGEKIELHFDAQVDEARVFADPTQLEQVLLNLAVNARDAMPRGGLLTMRTAVVTLNEESESGTETLMPGPYVTLVVQDTGCGMDAETQARIFEPFFTTKDMSEGTGLGLATVYGIINQSGGAIVVDSRPNEGAKFTVYLPQATEALEPARPAAPPLEPSTEAATILVVEDELIVRELVCAVLSSQGYDVLCAEDGFEALRLAKDANKPIDLLLSDVIMPGMTGPEVARELLVFSPETKVLFVSGYSQADISKDGVLSPGVNLLPKPFTADVLGRRVREVLESAEEPVAAGR
jgi:signal transduction histidine kinase/CheY-like chemotaxis protein